MVDSNLIGFTVFVVFVFIFYLYLLRLIKMVSWIFQWNWLSNNYSLYLIDDLRLYDLLTDDYFCGSVNFYLTVLNSKGFPFHGWFDRSLSLNSIGYIFGAKVLLFFYMSLFNNFSDRQDVSWKYLIQLISYYILGVFLLQLYRLVLLLNY